MILPSFVTGAFLEGYVEFLHSLSIFIFQVESLG